MRRVSLLLLILLLAGCTLKSNPSQTQGKVLASFDGFKITEQDFLKKIAVLPRALQSVAVNRKKDLLEDMAAEHFLMKEAQRQGLARDPEVKEVLEQAQKKIIIAKLIENEVDKKISMRSEEVTQYYELHQEEFMTPLSLRASHILVKTEEEAVAIKAALYSGADFEETARQRSTDATAVRGGDLGYFQKGQFVPEFEQAVFSLKKNEISSPVKTQFGYHVIKLNDRVEPRLRDFQSVKNVVEERLVQARRNKAFKDYLAKLKGNIKLEIDDQALEALAVPSQ